jgi:uncharacterized membrane protein YkvA (DUF1232 family)
MSTWQWLVVAAGIAVALYGLFVGVLILAGRRGEARALARFVPDCVVLFQRLLGDPRISRRRKAFLALLVAYLAMPFDIVPDFIPIAGVLDDAIIVILVLRLVVRGAGPELLHEHWPGPEESLRVVLRAAYPTAVGG